MPVRNEGKPRQCGRRCAVKDDYSKLFDRKGMTGVWGGTATWLKPPWSSLHTALSSPGLFPLSFPSILGTHRTVRVVCERHKLILAPSASMICLTLVFSLLQPSDYVSQCFYRFSYTTKQRGTGKDVKKKKYTFSILHLKDKVTIIILFGGALSVMEKIFNRNML